MEWLRDEGTVCSPTRKPSRSVACTPAPVGTRTVPALLSALVSRFSSSRCSLLSSRSSLLSLRCCFLSRLLYLLLSLLSRLYLASRVCLLTGALHTEGGRDGNGAAPSIAALLAPGCGGWIAEAAAHAAARCQAERAAPGGERAGHQIASTSHHQTRSRYARAYLPDAQLHRHGALTLVFAEFL